MIKPYLIINLTRLVCRIEIIVKRILLFYLIIILYRNVLLNIIVSHLLRVVEVAIEYEWVDSP